MLDYIQPVDTSAVLLKTRLKSETWRQGLQVSVTLRASC